MRFLPIVLLSFLVLASTAKADSLPYSAGFKRITVKDGDPFHVMLAYPTDEPEKVVQADPFTLSVSPNAPIAGGAPFPVILFSHGNGRKRGSPMIHADLLLHLARQGFITVAPYHTGARPPLTVRPRQLRQALDAAVSDTRIAGRTDMSRIGTMGFSFGGAVALIAAGAAPSLAHLSSYCRDHPADRRACAGIPTDGSLANAPVRKSPDALPVKAIALLEPFGAVFDRTGLSAIKQPVLIYRALGSDLSADGNALALAAALPRPPQLAAVPGGHFVFIGPCPDAVAAEAPALCRDTPKVDRTKTHPEIKRRVADFFRKNL